MNEDKRDKNRQAWAAKTDALSDKLLCKRTFFLHFNFEKLLSPKLFRAKFSEKLSFNFVSVSSRCAIFYQKWIFLMQNRGKSGKKFRENLKFKSCDFYFAFCVFSFFRFYHPCDCVVFFAVVWLGESH